MSTMSLESVYTYSTLYQYLDVCEMEKFYDDRQRYQIDSTFYLIFDGSLSRINNVEYVHSTYM